MRVLFVSSRYFPHRGGLETVVREVALVLRASGHTVEIVTNRYPRTLPCRDAFDGIPLTRLHFLYPELQHLRAGRLDLWLAGFVLFPITLLQLYILLRRFRPDVVNLHYLGAPSLVTWILQRLMHFPLMTSLHGGDVDGEPHRSQFHRWLFCAILDSSANVTACSQALARQAARLAPSSLSKIRIVHNGVNTCLFRDAAPYLHARPYFLGVGQLVRHKGFDTLLVAFAGVAERLLDCDVLIAGDGPERDALSRLIAEKGLSARVTLLGALDREAIASLMRGATAIVIPSRREPFGVVAIEAMAAGRPIIATKTGGLTEALDGADVCWIEPDDPDALRNALVLIAAQASAYLPANQVLAYERDWVKVGNTFAELLTLTACSAAKVGAAHE